jgi:hypothetical protein
MGIDIKQNTDGSAGLQGAGGGDGEFVLVDMQWQPTTLSGPSVVASRDYILKSLLASVEVAGTDAGAVTAVVWMAPSGTALASGTALHSGTINLKGTAATNQVLALTAANQRVPAGYRVGIVFTGTMTAATGCVTAGLCPA